MSEPALGMGVPGCGWEVVARLTMPVETARGYGQYVDRELEIVVSTPNGSVVADETYPVRVLLPYADLYDTGASNP